MEQTKRIRLNQEYRNKIAKRIELGLDQENTIEKEKYLQLREQIKPPKRCRNTVMDGMRTRILGTLKIGETDELRYR